MPEQPAHGRAEAQHERVFVWTYSNRGDEVQAFAEGLRNLGVDHEVVDGAVLPGECDVLVTWSLPHPDYSSPRDAAWKLARRHLVLERGYVRRDAYHACGWERLNNHADFRIPVPLPADRRRHCGFELKPWRKDGEHIVLAAQAENDKSLVYRGSCTNNNAWCLRTAHQLAALTDRPIVYRPHPLHPHLIHHERIVRCSRTEPLEECLENAWALVTYSSNSAVEAAMLGVPVFLSNDIGMAWPIANTSINNIEDPWMPDREYWLNGLAYTQWTKDEMAAGLPWLQLTGERS